MYNDKNIVIGDGSLLLLRFLRYKSQKVGDIGIQI